LAILGCFTMQGFTDAKLGRCIVRSEFTEYSITARVKRLEPAA
jgi:hypothetical protein